ncbi:MAG TPA: type I-E CRISPR-associated protein Cas5/CasD [Anaerolineales bacterium]|nr:type I-E CRISPR-associated protein Cas5/CasD [Anaerolineales bacterium]
MANTLFLRLTSPLQSWGEDSQWSERRTAPEPTKSGVVGLLACALGWADDERIRNLSRRVRVGVRCDVPGTPSPLRDYHTVGGGYDEPQLLTAEGKPKYVTNTKKPHTEPTWRYYLCDASFLVAVQSDDATVEELAQAVQFPAWQIYLGRKSCVPSRPLFDGVGEYDSLQSALEGHPARFLDRNEARYAESLPRIVIECETLEPGSVRRRVQLASRNYWIHEPRYFREDRVRNAISIEYIDKGV